MLKIFGFTKKYLLQCKWLLGTYIFISIIVSGSGLVSPYIIGSFIDHLMDAQDIGFIYRYFGLFGGINITLLLLGYVSGRMYVRLQARLGYAVNRDFINRLQRVPISYMIGKDTAYLNQRVNNDSNALVIFCVGIVQNVLVNAFIIIAALWFMFLFHPFLAVVLLCVASIYSVFYASYRKVLFKASFALQESQSRFFMKLNEQMFNIRYIKLHGLFGSFLSSLGQTVQSNIVSYNRLSELVNINPEPNGERVLERIERITMKQVSFAYGDKQILQKIDFTFEKGRIYAVVGPNGTGKSTFVDVLIGLQVGQYEGQVLYNGLPMEELDMYRLRNEKISVTEQEPVLIQDTIAVNAGINETNEKKADVLSRTLSLDGYISGLPDRYGTVVNEKADSLSGGEKQKLSILRALLKNPDVLVLDEPTSALDERSKTAFYAYLQRIKKDKIIVLVTHEIEFLEISDGVLRMAKR